MLDDFRHQGAGLRGITHVAAPRVIALTSHGDQTRELPLLWSLCSSWTNLGYSVAVLDATSLESADNPGLEQLLEATYWQADAHTEHPSWVIHPAAHGLDRLCNQEEDGKLPLLSLASLFHQYDVIVIFAPATFVASFFPDSGIQPLLAVSPNEISVLTAYHALKHMLLNARLRPTIISIVNEQTSSASTFHMNKSLQDCAMTFLGHQLNTLSVYVPSADEGVSDDINSLALRLLENAVPLYRTTPMTPTASCVGEAASLARSY